jgi:DNA-binding GntR family transcriptional regulator
MTVSQPPAFAPVERDTMQERVYGELRRALMCGHFPPGAVLVVRALANQFGTSQMPVRDALARLVAEQAIEVSPSRSIAVPLMTVDRCRDVQEMRETLECRAAALATANITDNGIAELRRLEDGMRKAVETRDAEAYVVANWRFHFALYAASQRPVMLHVIEALWLQIGPSLRGCIDEIFETPEVSRVLTVDHHRDMLDALARRDADGVRRAVAGDLEGLTTYLLQSLAPA